MMDVGRELQFHSKWKSINKNISEKLNDNENDNKMHQTTEC